METKVKEKKNTFRPRVKNKPLGVEKIAMSYEYYDNWEPNDGFKYDWKNGFALKNSSIMKNTERFIIANINRKFVLTQSFKSGGELFQETRCLLNNLETRIPDIAFFTKPQIIAAANDENPIPSFVIEIISKNENTYETEAKIESYFNAGVQTVWQIFPNLKQVWIFTDLKGAKILRDKEICSAAPSMPDFFISVDDIFKI